MSSLPSDQAAHLLNAFTSFLTVAIHSLLYHRALYPATSFLTARAHNLPVHQSRHPGVCAWVRDAVAAAEAQIRKGAARSVALVVHAPPEQSLAVLERWVFDLRDFPVAASWGSSVAVDAMTTATTAAEDNGATTDAQATVSAEDEDAVNWTDVNEALRGALSKIAYAAERSQALPEDCTFTLAVELHEQAAAPIGVSDQPRVSFL
ncbi:hypothetical protein K4F52_003170 [Lecanicillium sp. MT-2017a]|nr:hypothetical protein K4F52_003170 [Lecanicillium sp. MT-2017a]